MSTDQETINRRTLTQGEAARLSGFLHQNLDQFRGKGYRYVAKQACESLVFDVTDTNVKNLCTSEHLPELAVINPKVLDEANAVDLHDLATRVEQLQAEMTAAAGTHANFQIKVEQLFREMGANLDSAIGEQRQTQARADWVIQIVGELVIVLARDMDLKSWSAKWYPHVSPKTLLNNLDAPPKDDELNLDGGQAHE